MVPTLSCSCEEQLAGFQLHVPKPVEPIQLVAVVTNLAGRAGMADGIESV